MSTALRDDSLPSTLDDLVAELYRLTWQRDQLDTRAVELKRKIALQLRPGQRWVNDAGVGVQLDEKPSYRFNAGRAATVLAGTDWLNTVTVPAPDKERCQQYLPDRLYKACCTEVPPSLRQVATRGKA